MLIKDRSRFRLLGLGKGKGRKVSGVQEALFLRFYHRKGDETNFIVHTI